jgi:hypothetical protein
LRPFARQWRCADSGEMETRCLDHDNARRIEAEVVAVRAKRCGSP